TLYVQTVVLALNTASSAEAQAALAVTSKGNEHADVKTEATTSTGSLALASFVVQVLALNTAGSTPPAEVHVQVISFVSGVGGSSNGLDQTAVLPIGLAPGTDLTSPLDGVDNAALFRMLRERL